MSFLYGTEVSNPPPGGRRAQARKARERHPDPDGVRDRADRLVHRAGDRL